MTHMKRMQEIERRAKILRERCSVDMSDTFFRSWAEVGMRLNNDPEDDRHWKNPLDKEK